MLEASSYFKTIQELGMRGPLRPRDLDGTGIPRTYLKRLCDRGVLERVGHGLYHLTAFSVSEHHTLAQVCKRVPQGVVCLLSALQLHGLTTEAPAAVWLLIETHARKPRTTTVRLEVVRASGSALDYGVEVRDIEGVPVRVTSPAKTVADCFRYRRHVGLEVALSALRDYLRGGQSAVAGGRPPIDALVEAARADRSWTVVRPYLEALV